MQLRNYQLNSINELSVNWKNHKRQVLCLPTGAGKTIVFSEIVRRSSEKGTVTLVLTDRTELFKQTVKALGKFSVAVEEISPSKKEIYKDATVFVGMVETLSRRKQVLESIKPKLIIIDEAHKGNFNKIIDAFPDAFVIGATATPIGKHFYNYYTNIVQPIDVPELVEKGFLNPCKAFQMQDDFSDLQVKRGEFTTESLNDHFDKPKLFDGVVDKWKEKANNKKTIVFCSSIEHSIKTAGAFIKSGIAAEYITSKTSNQERERILKAFKDGAFNVLCNCGILTTGYDEPSIECVILNRATLSLILFLQMIGRGSRLYPPHKDSFITLDFGGNHDRFGMWNEAREWSIEPPKKKRKGIGVVPVKDCPECGAMLKVQVSECEYCGHKFEPKANQLKKDGILVELTVKDFEGKKVSELSIEELIQLQKLKTYKASYIWRVVRSKGEEKLSRYASLMNYSKGWINRQIESLEDCSYKDYKVK